MFSNVFMNPPFSNKNPSAFSNSLQLVRLEKRLIRKSVLNLIISSHIFNIRLLWCFVFQSMVYPLLVIPFYKLLQCFFWMLFLSILHRMPPLFHLAIGLWVISPRSPQLNTNGIQFLLKLRKCSLSLFVLNVGKELNPFITENNNRTNFIDQHCLIENK